MLDYITLKNKPLLSVPKSENSKDTMYIKDLAVQSVNPNVQIHSMCSYVTVTKDYIARPDLVSLAMYGTDQYGDIICKVNGISNPFELNVGMTLLIPDLQMVLNTFKQNVKSSTILDNDEITNIRKNNQKLKNERRTPNEQVIGESNFVIDKAHRIVYY